MISGIALTALVGASIGLFSAGGSIVMLPVLVYVVGVEAHAAVPLSLLIVGVTSLAALVLRGQHTAAPWRSAALFGFAAIAGALAGSRMTYAVPAAVLLLTFGLLLTAVGGHMLRALELTVVTGRARPRVLLPAGAAVGLLTGFLGVGGGFLIVPAFTRIGRASLREAMKASLIVITMSSAAGLLAHALQGNSVSIALAAPLVGAALAGMWAGAQLESRLSSAWLRMGFAALVLGVGVFLIVGNLAPAMRLLR